MLTQRFQGHNSGALKPRPVFYLDQVTVDFGRLKALKNVSLAVHSRDILFVTGPSGAGKSTLLNVMAGFTQPSTGRVQLAQEDGNFFAAHVFQDLRLMAQKSCEDNLWVSYDPTLYASRNEFHKDMVEYCRALGVYDFLNHKIDTCNGGLKQKVALVRALLSRPDALLADEPTAALDRDNSYKLFELLNHLNQRRSLTIIWATHNKELIKQFPGKMAHLNQGQLVYSGHACFI